MILYTMYLRARIRNSQRVFDELLKHQVPEQLTRTFRGITSDRDYHFTHDDWELYLCAATGFDTMTLCKKMEEEVRILRPAALNPATLEKLEQFVEYLKKKSK